MGLLQNIHIARAAESAYPERRKRPQGCVAVEEELKQASKASKPKRFKWLWPMGLMATGLAGAAVVIRGCWHSRMSWPVRSQGCAYQVCTGCGIKRLFDEDAFRGYGPYSYDLQHLVAIDRAKRLKHKPEEPPSERRSAS